MISRIKRFFTALMVAVLLFSTAVMPVGAVAPWNTTGDYQVTFMLTGDTTPYVHDMMLTQTGSSIDGTGGYPAGGPYTYTWDITSGSLSGDTITLAVTYLTGATGTLMNMTGNIATDGTVTGTWTDNFGGPRSGTWSITDGVSVPAIHTPANNATVTQSALVKVDWTDAIGSNPPFEYQYQAFSDAGYTTSVYQSVWLAASEIPTPGTPPGEYYLRVRARDEAAVESAWSNDAANPYHITVTANSVNPFTVPAECNQTTAYNLIEGTNGSEVLNGTSGADLILAKDGNDVVNGNGGNDCIVGGAGSDALRGDAGNDVILGGADSDSITGGAGNDDLYGEGGSDAISGQAGNDNLWGGAGSDALQGGDGTDTANGGAGSDACSAETQAQCNP